MNTDGYGFMSILYITQPGAELRKKGERLHVILHGDLLQAIPIQNVETVALLCPVQVSSAAVRCLLQALIPVFYFSRGGTYYGKLTSGGENVERWLIQVRRWQNQEYRLTLACSFVQGKIRHQRSVLRRHTRNHPDPELSKAAEQLNNLLRTVKSRSTLDQIRGVEGQASAVYFGVFGRCIRQEGLEFHGRNRRPPRDPVNSLLSLGYMLLLGEAVAALMSQGLQVGLGFLHEPSRRRQSLALDLLEIFRQPVADRLALSLVNRAVFTRRDFETQDDDGVRLTRAGLQRYLTLYERSLTSSFHPKGLEGPVTYRNLIRNQAAALRNSLENGQTWTPPAWEL